MPRYLYKCETCDQHTEVTHSITIKHKVCSEISEKACEGALTRIPSFSRYIKKIKKNSSEPVGSATRDAIESARLELKEQKKNLGGKEYND